MAETSGRIAVSAGPRLDHLACDAEIARLRFRAEAAERKLTAIGALEPYETCASTGADLVRVSDILAILGSEEGGASDA